MRRANVLRIFRTLFAPFWISLTTFLAAGFNNDVRIFTPLSVSFTPYTRGQSLFVTVEARVK